jgi:hypothetical protein
MEINEHYLQHQTNLVQYDELHEHDEDMVIVRNQYFYYHIHFLHYDDENKLLMQELLNFLIMLDVHEQLLMIHNHKQFELDQMHTKILILKFYLLNLCYTCAKSTELGSCINSFEN